MNSYIIYLSSLNKIWLSNAMASEKATSQELVAFKQMLKFKRRLSVKNSILYAASILLLVSLAINFFSYKQSKSAPQKGVERVILAEMEQEQKVSIYTNNGVKGNVVLPDGSTVWLNSATLLTYPVSFKGDTREVELVGEAYFQVVNDSLHPMIVSTGKNFYVEVLGTTFNLKAYANDNTSQATLYSGEIKVHTENEVTKEYKELLLKPMETILIDEKSSTTLISDIVSNKEINAEWKEGILIFKDTPLSEVIKRVHRWHGVQFTVKDSSILNYKITASFNSESAVQIMDMIRYIAPVNFNADGSRITLSRR